MDFLDPVAVSSNNHFPALMAMGLDARMARDISQVRISRISLNVVGVFKNLHVTY